MPPDNSFEFQAADLGYLVETWPRLGRSHVVDVLVEGFAGLIDPAIDRRERRGRTSAVGVHEVRRTEMEANAHIYPMALEFLVVSLVLTVHPAILNEKRGGHRRREQVFNAGVPIPKRNIVVV
jgi:hypothetical protein